MVEYSLNLNSIFSSLADPTRRDILRRVAKKPLSISQIAKHYKLTFAAVSKHLKVLQKAGLVVKTKKGKEQMVELYPKALASADEHLRQYEDIWKGRLNKLEGLLNKTSNK